MVWVVCRPEKCVKKCYCRPEKCCTCCNIVPKSVWFELFVVPKSVLKNVIIVPKSVFMLDYQEVMFLLFVSMSMIVFLEIMCFVGVNIDGVCLEKFTLLYIFAKKCCNTFVIAYCLTKI